ncbi:MAG: MFS transporter [Chloroflexota bacterium]
MAAEKPRFFSGYIIVLSAFCSQALVWGTCYTFGIFFKPISAEFGWDRAVISGAFSLATVIQGVSNVAAGRLTDRFGPRPVVTVLTVFMGLGYLLMSRVSAAWQMYLFYGVILGVGMGTAFTPFMSTLARWFVQRRGLMTGITTVGGGMGIMLVPPLARWLISGYGWRTTYLILGTVILVVMGLAAQLLKRDPSQTGQLPDGAAEGRTYRPRRQVVEFNLREAVRTTQLWRLGAVFFFLGITVESVMIHLVPYATDLGISAVNAASLMVVIGGVSIIGRLGMGALADRVGSRWTVTASFIILTITLVWLLGTRELWMLYLFAGLYGIANGALFTLFSPYVGELFGTGSHGVILGITNLWVVLGGAIGAVVTGWIFDVYGSYYFAFLVLAGLALVAVVIMATLTPAQNRKGDSGSAPVPVTPAGGAYSGPW